ncbi:DNA replication/repair protein RecF [bacterium]|nr:MAG: DNA replication/repair protein RecF [bacterium]
MLKSVSIQNYKNLQISNLELGDRLNLFVAENGYGKTNLLEAIYYLTNGFAFRKVSDEVSINLDFDSSIYTHKFFNVTGEYSSHNEVIQKQVYFEKGERIKKLTRINEKHKTKSEFRSKIVATIFSPESIDLISDSAEVRRSEIDDFAKLYYPDYEEKLIKFNLTLRNRNKVLKLASKSDVPENFSNDIKFWTEQFLEISEEVIKTRLQVLDLIKPKVGEIAKQIYHFENNIFELNYISRYKADKLELKKLLNTSTEKEKVLGQTMYGPQKDDVQVLLNSQDLRSFGSRGQMRLASFIIKVAFYELFQEAGYSSILLLDDLPSELDEKHLRNVEDFLLNNLTSQAILTAASGIEYSDEFKKRSNILVIHGI